MKENESTMKEIIEMILKQRLLNNLSHGSGIDCDWDLEFRWDKGQILCRNSYHCMNENGFYDGYADFTLLLGLGTKCFRVMFHGQYAQNKAKKYGLRDYLEDTFASDLVNFYKEIDAID